MSHDSDPSEQSSRGKRVARRGQDHGTGTTGGAPYPPADTQGDGPVRRAPRVPASATPEELEPDQLGEPTLPAGGDDA